MNKKPNLFVVGAPKAATTTLHEMLGAVQGIFMSPVKEPHHFSLIGKNVPSVVSVQPRSEYLKLFKAADGATYIGESSVSYLYSYEACRAIKEFNHDAKIIVMLRNPLDRMYSHWLMDKRDGLQTKDFREAVVEDEQAEARGFGVSHMYAECSRYFKYVSKYMEVHGKENIYVGFFEDFKDDPQRFLRDLLNWLDLPEANYDIKTLRSNPAAEPRGLLFRWIYHNYALRKFLKNILSSRIKSVLRSLVLKKSGPSYIKIEDKDFFKDWFLDDVEQLQSIVRWDYSRWVEK